MNIPIKQLSGADATEALERTIVAINESSAKQTRHIIFLTYAMLLLTLVMAFMVGAQIWLSIEQSEKMKQTKNIPTAVSPPNPSPAQTVPSHLPKDKNTPPSPQVESPEKG